MILAVDPGRITGFAIFRSDGLLLRLGVARPKEILPNLIKYDRLVIERPHGGQGKASRKNLVTLARRMQSVIDSVSADAVEEVEPMRWKGQTDGDMMTARIRDRWMSDLDRAILAGARIPQSYAHNAIDAYGLGRWYFAKEGILELPRGAR
jgi:hypothetical protein